METLPGLSSATANVDQGLISLPEKAVQFGTGAFLRGFIEYFIDDANRKGLFGGRVVAIGSTGSGRDRLLNHQNGLYTLAIRGVKSGVLHNDYRLMTSLSRALSAQNDWDAVLACARSPELELIFSNTTETGIRIDDGDVPGPHAPKSFPAKLTRFLFERALAFDYAVERGVVVLPCELIEDNGTRLRELVLATAQRWQLDRRFEAWIQDAVRFCNTLVDRIVPGEPDAEDMQAAWMQLGYRDELLTVCEVYRLYAIEADAETARKLRFTKADPNIIITTDISPYRQRKVRLLNGTHTIMTPAALLAGCETVGEAVQDEQVGAFVRRILFQELVPSTDAEEADAFAAEVLDRFSNPYIRHALLDITLQQTAKMRVRVIPAILGFIERAGSVPTSMALGFAAYLLYVRDDGANARIDDSAERIRAAWRSTASAAGAVSAICGDSELWGHEFENARGFATAVTDAVNAIGQAGIRAALEQHLAVPERA